MNKIFEKAYDYLISGFIELLKELRKDKVDIIKAIKDAPENSAEKIRLQVKNHETAILQGLEKINQTIANQKNPLDDVDFGGIKDNILGSLNSITETIKKEVGKMDKQVVIKNDLSTLYGLFKQNSEAKTIVKAISRVEEAISNPKDYSKSFDGVQKELIRIAGKLDKVFVNVDFAPLTKDLSNIADLLKKIPKFTLDEYAQDGRIKVVLPDNQQGGMSGMYGIPSSLQIKDVSKTVVNPATEETLQSVLAAQGGTVYNFIQSAEDATYKYYGYASSTGWKIKRKTLASGVWEVAEDTGDYDTAWTGRAAQSYSYT